MLVLSYHTNPVSIVFGSFSPFDAFTAASTHLYPLPTGSWVIALSRLHTQVRGEMFAGRPDLKARSHLGVRGLLHL